MFDITAATGRVSERRGMTPHYRNQEEWLTQVIGECLSQRDATAKAVSLWYALGVDLLTDLISATSQPTSDDCADDHQ